MLATIRVCLPCIIGLSRLNPLHVSALGRCTAGLHACRAKTSPQCIHAFLLSPSISEFSFPVW